MIIIRDDQPSKSPKVFLGTMPFSTRSARLNASVTMLSAFARIRIVSGDHDPRLVDARSLQAGSRQLDFADNALDRETACNGRQRDMRDGACISIIFSTLNSRILSLNDRASGKKMASSL